MSIKRCCDNCAFENIREFCSCKYDIEYPVEDTDMFMPKKELVRQDYKSQLIHDFREYIDVVIKYYNGLCGTPDGYDYGVRKGFEMAIKYIIKYDYKEE